MKKLTVITLFLLTGITAWAQITLTADGKKVEKLTCDMKDVKLSIPLPTNYKGYDLVNVIIERHIPEFAEGAYLELGGFFRDYSASFFDGKNKIDIALVKPNGESDLLMNLFNYYTLASACNDPMRNYTYVENTISIRGAKHAGFEWRGNQQIKTYTYDILKTYSFNIQIGPINTFYVGPLQKFSIDKVSYGDVEVKDYGSLSNIFFKDSKAGGSQNDIMDMGGASPAKKIGEVIINSEILKSSETNVETVKTGVQFNIIRASNSSFTLNGYDIPFDHMSNYNIGHVYLPVAAKARKKADTEVAAQKIMGNQNQYFNWTKVMLAGVEFNKLEIDIYEDTQVGSNDAWATMVDKGEVGKTRKLVVLIGQKGDDIYCLAMFKTEVEGLTANEGAFFNNVEKTFKFLK